MMDERFRMNAYAERYRRGQSRIWRSSFNITVHTRIVLLLSYLLGDGDIKSRATYSICQIMSTPLTSVGGGVVGVFVTGASIDVSIGSSGGAAGVGS